MSVVTGRTRRTFTKDERKDRIAEKIRKMNEQLQKLNLVAVAEANPEVSAKVDLYKAARSAVTTKSRFIKLNAKKRATLAAAVAEQEARRIELESEYIAVLATLAEAEKDTPKEFVKPISEIESDPLPQG
jgi:septation ring formation regulator EzrA